jgi:hypothetical protein
MVNCKNYFVFCYLSSNLHNDIIREQERGKREKTRERSDGVKHFVIDNLGKKF